MSMVVESQEGASDNGLLAGPPQELMEELDMQGTQGTVVKINRFGTAFAIGTSCGSILIYDYTTKLLVAVRRFTLKHYFQNKIDIKFYFNDF